MKPYVMDSSAVIALAFGESGSEELGDLLSESAISTVNAAEVIARFIDRGENPDDAYSALLAFGLEVVSFDQSQSALAASLRFATRSSGLSLGDRACLALANERGACAITADRAWAELDIGIEMKVFR